MAEEKNSKGGDWDFKVADEDLEKVEVKKKARTKKASGAAPSPSELKKAPRKKPRLEVEQKTKKRMTRGAIARRDAALENFAELMPPSFINRAISTVIDYGIIAGGWFGSKFFMADLYREYVKLLSDNGIDQTLHPDDLEKYISIAITVVVALFIVYFPVLLFKATPGKSIMEIRVGHKVIGEKPSKFMILLREMVFKPLSVASVIGLLIGLKNDGNRCLHDMLTNTALYIDD
ncbi:MAG: RDD family protein [Halobacteriovoraceae bacterium]|nr:RDD family protein [Halobacteriovoraceae bacterium]